MLFSERKILKNELKSFCLLNLDNNLSSTKEEGSNAFTFLEKDYYTRLLDLILESETSPKHYTKEDFLEISRIRTVVSEMLNAADNQFHREVEEIFSKEIDELEKPEQVRSVLKSIDEFPIERTTLYQELIDKLNRDKFVIISSGTRPDNMGHNIKFKISYLNDSNLDSKNIMQLFVYNTGDGINHHEKTCVNEINYISTIKQYFFYKQDLEGIVRTITKQYIASAIIENDSNTYKYGYKYLKHHEKEEIISLITKSQEEIKKTIASKNSSDKTSNFEEKMTSKYGDLIFSSMMHTEALYKNLDYFQSKISPYINLSAAIISSNNPIYLSKLGQVSGTCTFRSMNPLLSHELAHNNTLKKKIKYHLKITSINEIYKILLDSDDIKISSMLSTTEISEYLELLLKAIRNIQTVRDLIIMKDPKISQEFCKELSLGLEDIEAQTIDALHSLSFTTSNRYPKNTMLLHRNKLINPQVFDKIDEVTSELTIKNLLKEKNSTVIEYINAEDEYKLEDILNKFLSLQSTDINIIDTINNLYIKIFEDFKNKIKDNDSYSSLLNFIEFYIRKNSKYWVDLLAVPGTESLFKTIHEIQAYPMQKTKHECIKVDEACNNFLKIIPNVSEEASNQMNQTDPSLKKGIKLLQNFVDELFIIEVNKIVNSKNCTHELSNTCSEIKIILNSLKPKFKKLFIDRLLNKTSSSIYAYLNQHDVNEAKFKLKSENPAAHELYKKFDKELSSSRIYSYILGHKKIELLVNFYGFNTSILNPNSKNISKSLIDFAYNENTSDMNTSFYGVLPVSKNFMFKNDEKIYTDYFIDHDMNDYSRFNSDKSNDKNLIDIIHLEPAELKIFDKIKFESKYHFSLINSLTRNKLTDIKFLEYLNKDQFIFTPIFMSAVIPRLYFNNQSLVENILSDEDKISSLIKGLNHQISMSNSDYIFFVLDFMSRLIVQAHYSGFDVTYDSYSRKAINPLLRCFYKVKNYCANPITNYHNVVYQYSRFCEVLTTKNDIDKESFLIIIDILNKIDNVYSKINSNDAPKQSKNLINAFSNRLKFEIMHLMQRYPSLQKIVLNHWIDNGFLIKKESKLTDNFILEKDNKDFLLHKYALQPHSYETLYKNLNWKSLPKPITEKYEFLKKICISEVIFEKDCYNIITTDKNYFNIEKKYNEDFVVTWCFLKNISSSTLFEPKVTESGIVKSVQYFYAKNEGIEFPLVLKDRDFNFYFIDNNLNCQLKIDRQQNFYYPNDSMCQNRFTSEVDEELASSFEQISKIDGTTLLVKNGNHKFLYAHYLRRKFEVIDNKVFLDRNKHLCEYISKNYTDLYSTDGKNYYRTTVLLPANTGDGETFKYKFGYEIDSRDIMVSDSYIKLNTFQIKDDILIPKNFDDALLAFRDSFFNSDYQKALHYVPMIKKFNNGSYSALSAGILSEIFSRPNVILQINPDLNLSLVHLLLIIPEIKLMFDKEILPTLEKSDDYYLKGLKIEVINFYSGKNGHFYENATSIIENYLNVLNKIDTKTAFQLTKEELKYISEVYNVSINSEFKEERRNPILLPDPKLPMEQEIPGLNIINFDKFFSRILTRNILKANDNNYENEGYLDAESKRINREISAVKAQHKYSAKLITRLKDDLKSINLDEIKYFAHKFHNSNTIDLKGLLSYCKKLQLSTQSSSVTNYKKEKINFDNLIKAFVQYDNTNLSKFFNNDINIANQILQSVGNILTNKIRSSRINKIIDCIDTYNINACDKHQEELIQAICEYVSEYDVTNYRKNSALICIEALNHIRLRKSQVDTIENLSNNFDKVSQIIMGGGKTSVILPILALKNADKKHLSIIIVPEELINTNAKDLGNKSKSLFSSKANLLFFDRKMLADKEKSSRYIADTLCFLRKIIDNKEYLISTKETVQSYELAFIDTLSTYSQEELISKDEITLLNNLREILHIFKKSNCIIDEIDTVLDITQELNFSTGKKSRIDRDKVELVISIYKSIGYGERGLLFQQDADKIKEKINWVKHIFAKNPKYIIKELDSKTILGVLNEVEEDLFTFGNNIVKKLLVKKDMEKAGLIYCMKILTNGILLKSLTADFNVNYGLNNKNLVAIPYVANNVPAENSIFSSELETLCYTIQSIMQLDRNDSRLKPLIIKLLRHDFNNLLKTVNQINPNSKDKKLISEFEDKYGVSLNLVRENTDSIGKILPNVLEKGDIESIKYGILDKYISKDIATYNKKINGNSINFVEQFNKVNGFSGTLASVNTFNARLEKTNANQIIDGVTLNVLITKNPSIRSISMDKISVKELRLFMEENLRNLGKKRAIIDIGALFSGIHNYDVAMRLSEFFARNHRDIKWVLYYDSSNNLNAISVSNKKIVNIGASDKNHISKVLRNCSESERFTYYDQSHTTGSDISQMDNAVALVLLDSTTNLRDLLQGVMRMRKLSESQSVEFVLSNRMDPSIKNIHHVIEYTHRHEIEEMQRKHVSSYFANMNSVLRTHALNSLISNKMTNKSEINKAYEVIKQIPDLFFKSKPNEFLVIRNSNPKLMILFVTKNYSNKDFFKKTLDYYLHLADKLFNMISFDSYEFKSSKNQIANKLINVSKHFQKLCPKVIASKQYLLDKTEFTKSEEFTQIDKDIEMQSESSVELDLERNQEISTSHHLSWVYSKYGKANISEDSMSLDLDLTNEKFIKHFSESCLYINEMGKNLRVSRSFPVVTLNGENCSLDNVLKHRDDVFLIFIVDPKNNMQCLITPTNDTVTFHEKLVKDKNPCCYKYFITNSTGDFIIGKNISPEEILDIKIDGRFKVLLEKARFVIGDFTSILKSNNTTTFINSMVKSPSFNIKMNYIYSNNILLEAEFGSSNELSKKIIHKSSGFKMPIVFSKGRPNLIEPRYSKEEFKSTESELKLNI